MPMPTSPFNIAHAIYAGRSVVSFTSNVALATAVIFETISNDYKDGSKYAPIMRPDAKGTKRTVARYLVEGGEEWTFEIDEAKRLVSDLFTGSLSGLATGIATLWFPDPNDATGKVALISEIGFACTVELEGGAKFGDGKPTTAKIKLSSLKAGPVIFTPDGTP